MPLDRERGEILGSLGSDYRIADAQKWAGLTQVQGDFMVPLSPEAARFRAAPEIQRMPVFTHALWVAKEAFRSAGAMWPVTIEPDDIRVQEYPRTSQIVFLFQRDIAGVTHYVMSEPYQLDETVVSSLVLAGQWQRPHLN